MVNATEPRLLARRLAQRERRARRALLLDVLVAVTLAVVALILAGGLGVVGFVCLPVLVLGLAWIGTERLLLRVRHRRRLP